MTRTLQRAQQPGTECPSRKPLWKITVPCILLLAPLVTAYAQASEVRVVRVVDGDTVVVVADAQSLNIKVWPHVIDAPECGMPFGPQAQAFLEKLILGRPAQMETKGRDRYNRTVATLSKGGHDVGMAMISAGWAWHDERYAGRWSAAGSDPYAAAQRAARDRTYGLWAEAKPNSPWRWRAERNRTGSGVSCQERSTERAQR
jgi:endonuclease YncB( thermonuclease family)